MGHGLRSVGPNSTVRGVPANSLSLCQADRSPSPAVTCRRTMLSFSMSPIMSWCFLSSRRFENWKVGEQLAQGTPGRGHSGNTRV